MLLGELPFDRPIKPLLMSMDKCKEAVEIECFLNRDFSYMPERRLSGLKRVDNFLSS